MTAAEQVVAYIRANQDFKVVDTIEGWGHMGATLTDAILQAGIDYNTLVFPRAKRIHDQFPDASTTSGFARVIEREGAANLLNWKGEKVERLTALVALLMEKGIDTEDQLRSWLATPENMARARQIKGIKDKTAHYLQILVGAKAVAVDRHLFGFLERAGIVTSSYEIANKIIVETAHLLGVDPARLDHSIWLYMSGNSAKAVCASSDV